MLTLSVAVLALPSPNKLCSLVKSRTPTNPAMCFLEPECEQKCTTVTERKCRQRNNQQCATVNEQKCFAVDEQQCSTVTENQCTTTSEQQCATGKNALLTFKIISNCNCYLSSGAGVSHKHRAAMLHP